MIKKFKNYLVTTFSPEFCKIEAEMESSQSYRQIIDLYLKGINLCDKFKEIIQDTVKYGGKKWCIADTFFELQKRRFTDMKDVISRRVLREMEHKALDVCDEILRADFELQKRLYTATKDVISRRVEHKALDAALKKKAKLYDEILRADVICAWCRLFSTIEKEEDNKKKRHDNIFKQNPFLSTF